MKGFDFVDEKILNIHTAFFGIVVSMNGQDKAKVQPLNQTKQYGEKPIKQAVLTDVPVLKHVRPLETGEIVFCMCADRDITQARQGKSAVPALGHHEIKDAVVVGKL